MNANIHSFIISRSILLGMRNFADKSCKATKIYIGCLIIFLNSALYKLMWKNSVEQGRP
jgi:hypothetical protein